MNLERLSRKNIARDCWTTSCHVKATGIASVAYSFLSLSSFVRDVDFHFVRSPALGVAAFGFHDVVISLAGQHGCVGIGRFLNQLFVDRLRGIAARFLSSIEVVAKFSRTRAWAWVPSERYRSRRMSGQTRLCRTCDNNYDQQYDDAYRGGSLMNWLQAVKEDPDAIKENHDTNLARLSC